MTLRAERGCELHTKRLESLSGATLRSCRNKPARMVRSKMLGWEVAVCERCFKLIDPGRFDMKRSWAEHETEAEFYA